MDLELFISEVKLDLSCQRDIGVFIPDEAFKRADELAGDEVNMSVIEASDLCVKLAS